MAYDYTKTMKCVRDVETQLLLGMTHITAHQTLADNFPWAKNMSQRNTRRLVQIAKEQIKRRFEKDAETDYQFCRENYMRLLREAWNEGDRSEQRRLIGDFMKLSGLDEITINNKLDITSNDIDSFEKFFM